MLCNIHLLAIAGVFWNNLSHLMEMQPHIATSEFVDPLLEAVGHRSLIFQDLLDAGCNLKEVEEFSDHARSLGHNPVTVTVFLALTKEDRVFQSRVLPHVLGRLKHEC